MINYTLVRAARKTIAIHVRDGWVEVRAPHFYSQSDIDQFVVAKEKWITQKLAESSERVALRDSFALTYGDHVTYRGKQYPIAAENGDRISFDGARFNIPPDLEPDQVKHACIQIYRMLAKRDLLERSYEFSWKLRIWPHAVRVNGAKARWGSCSAKKSVNFSWLLIMADDDVIDYVVVHELAHIKEMNHSPRFWELVGSILPDYKERKERLVELQNRLATENWA